MHFLNNYVHKNEKYIGHHILSFLTPCESPPVSLLCESAHISKTQCKILLIVKMPLVSGS